jgi:putative ABC transport system substrate-binding protein
MKRRTFIAALGSAAAWPVVAQGQQTKVWRVGYLTRGFSSLKSPADAVAFGAFRQEMSNLGYVEGRNLIIEGRWPKGKWIVKLGTRPIGRCQM